MRWLLGLGLLFATLGVLALYLPELSERLFSAAALDGDLLLDGASLPPGPLPAGSFLISFQDKDGGRLVITHKSDPSRAVWESVPGRAFVSAGRGDEEVRESRGSFTLRDSLKARCDDQKLAALAPEGDGVKVSGSLRCDSGPELGYTRVSSMAGGFRSWKNAGYAFERPRVLTPEQRKQMADYMTQRRDMMQRHQRERQAIDAPKG